MHDSAKITGFLTPGTNYSALVCHQCDNLPLGYYLDKLRFERVDEDISRCPACIGTGLVAVPDTELER
jgi:hypothetical protein